MDDEEPISGSLGVVPYDNNREIVLRHNNAVVVYDPSSQQLALRSSNSTSDVDRPFCPRCHRAWPLQEDPASGRPVQSDEPGSQNSFRNPEYFRMLQRSLQNAGQGSPPPSPRRRLVQPALVPSSRDVPLESPIEAGPVESPPGPDESGPGISSSAFSQNFIQKVFVIKKELGRGGRGTVYLVEHVLDGVRLGLHACKRIPVGDDHEWLEKVLVEVQLLSRLHHPNLVAYQHVWLEKTQISNFGPLVPCAYILQEYCNGGDLQSYIVGNAQVTITKEQLKNRMRRRSKGDLEPSSMNNGARTLHFEDIYSFFRDITAGIQFLHSEKFIHRDLKPSNCLLHDTGRGIRVLVSDFGEVQEQDTVRKSTGATGTLSYCAPEVLRRISPGGPFGNFTFKSDIFSLGMILHFICFASLPYRNANVLHEESEDLDTLRVEVSSWTGFDGERRLRPDLPDELYMFLRRLLSVRPEDRPTADEISHGLKTRTGLAEASAQNPPTPTTPTQGFEELTPRRRIISLDSPAPSSSRTSPAPGNNGRSTAVAQRPSHLRHTSDGQTSSLVPEGSQSPHRGLILHRSLPSPNREPASSRDRQQRRNSTNPETIIHQTYLLTDGSPVRSTWIHRLHTFIHPRQMRRIFNFLLAVSKVVSLLQPCASRGMNPAIIYPLLLLALWDFGVGAEMNYGFSIGALVLHCAVLALSLHSDTLCAKRREWSTALN